MLVCVFLWVNLNPMTVPQLSLNKFSAPLGYRGLVLGLKVSYFFRSLGTSSGVRARRKLRPTGSAGSSWTPVSVLACFLFVFRCIR